MEGLEYLKREGLKKRHARAQVEGGIKVAAVYRKAGISELREVGLLRGDEVELAAEAPLNFVLMFK